jgi:MinD superfamily P-loop ATPase
MGESGSGRIVYLTKEKAEKIAKKEGASFILIDSAAGTGCPVIASVQGSDFVIAVTEPAQAAFHDLKKSLLVVEHFKIPYGLIINKFDINKNFSEKIERFAMEKNIPLLGKIPYDIKFVEALVNLTPLVLYAKEYEKLFNQIKENILSLSN